MTESIEKRTEECMVNLYYTFKQFYFASSIYSYLSIGSDLLLILVGAALTIGSTPSDFPLSAMVSMSITVSVVSLARAFWDPAGKSSKFHQTARKYQHLYEDFQDFKDLELTENDDREELLEKYKALKAQRQEMNEEAPEISSMWYTLMKKWKGDDLVAEGEVTDDERDNIAD